MYRINYLGRPTLVTADEVLFHAPTDGNIDARQIQQNIIVAEERFIAQALGDELYEELIKLKNRVVTAQNQAALLSDINVSLAAAGRQVITADTIPPGTIINAIEFISDADYLMLWNRFLWKLTAEAVDVMCIVPSWLRHTSQGQQKNNPEVIGGNGSNSASGDRRDIQLKMDNAIQTRIDPLIARMQQWICNKKKDVPASFQLYKKKCECEEEGVAVLRTSGWVFGAYEDDKRGCECKMNWIEWPSA